MNEREEELAARFQADHEAEIHSESIPSNGLRFNYDRGTLEDVEWVDPCDFLGHHNERLVEDAIADDSREAQRILSYAWLLVRQAEARKEDLDKTPEARSRMAAEHKALSVHVENARLDLLVSRPLPDAQEHFDLLKAQQDALRGKIRASRKPQLRAIESLVCDRDMDIYLEELCDPKGGW